MFSNNSLRMSCGDQKDTVILFSGISMAAVMSWEQQQKPVRQCSERTIITRLIQDLPCIPRKKWGMGFFPIVVYFVINNSKNYKTPSLLLLAKCKYHNLSSTLFSSTRTVQTFQNFYIQSKQVPSKKDEAVQSRKLQKKKFKGIHLVPKWRPINYYFVCMLISPRCQLALVVNIHKKQKNFENEAKRANKHANKRIIYWPPFWNIKVYASCNG